MPKPPRRTRRELWNGLYENPPRTAKLWLSALYSFSSPDPGKTTLAPAIRCTKLAPDPNCNCASFCDPTFSGDPKFSYRNPKFTASPGVIFQLSCANRKNC